MLYADDHWPHRPHRGGAIGVMDGPGQMARNEKTRKSPRIVRVF
jgi:hypothetical protein